MKVEYSVYDVDSKVFAINRMHDKEGKPTNFITIYDAVVDNVYIGKDKPTNSIKIEYWLRTPDGNEWGDVVSSDDVSDNFDELVSKIKPLWLSESNTFGD